MEMGYRDVIFREKRGAEAERAIYPVTRGSTLQDAVPVGKGGTGAGNALDARGNLGIQTGEIVIVPTAASVPTAGRVTFEKAFAQAPAVFVSCMGTAPGTSILGATADAVSETGCTVWVARKTTTAVTVKYIAIGMPA